MNADRLLALYDRVADAPGAVDQLRRFVLDLAVRGKLVEQDPEDEPASKLLERIAAEKARLVKTGEIRRKAANDPKMVESICKLPRSWRWVALGAIFQYDAGTKREPKSLDPLLWLLELEDIEKGSGRLVAHVTVAEREPKSTKSEFKSGDILYGKLRPYLTKVVVANEVGYSTTEVVAIRPFVALSSEYCALALRRPDFVSYVTRLGQGTKMPRLRTEDAVVSPFPLPPLAEQRRIVARVEELMALLDRLEAARAVREDTRDRLAAASLARLTAPETAAEDVPVHARFALDALPALATRADQIKSLRRTILNLAVRGKLVEQDSADEPASASLKRIAEKRAQLIKEGAMPRKREAVRDLAKLNCTLPASWSPISLGSVCSLVTSGSRGWAEFYATSGPTFIRAQNIRFGKLQLDQVAHVNPPANSEGSRTQVAEGDLLVVITGAGVTNPAMLDHDVGEAYVSQHVGLVRPAEPQLSTWILLCLMADAGGREELVECAYGSGKPGLNLDNIRSLSIPVPPLAEQRRIVAKVDALMTLCNQLETALRKADTTRARLLDALIHEALSPAALDAHEAAA